MHVHPDSIVPQRVRSDLIAMPPTRTVAMATTPILTRDMEASTVWTPWYLSRASWQEVLVEVVPAMEKAAQ